MSKARATSVAGAVISKWIIDLLDQQAKGLPVSRQKFGVSVLAYRTKAGGVFVKAHGRTYGDHFIMAKDSTVSGRLRPGYNRDQLAMLINRLATQVIWMNARFRYLEALRKRFDALDESITADADKIEQETGHTSVYIQMTYDDIEFWNRWIDVRTKTTA